MSGPWAPEPDPVAPPRHEVTIVDINVPTMSLVRFMFRWFLAMIIVVGLPVGILYLIAGLFALAFDR